MGAICYFISLTIVPADWRERQRNDFIFNKWIKEKEKVVSVRSENLIYKRYFLVNYLLASIITLPNSQKSESWTMSINVSILLIIFCLLPICSSYRSIIGNRFITKSQLSLRAVSWNVFLFRLMWHNYRNKFCSVVQEDQEVRELQSLKHKPIIFNHGVC